MKVWVRKKVEKRTTSILARTQFEPLTGCQFEDFQREQDIN